jgi:hypothetical protein
MYLIKLYNLIIFLLYENNSDLLYEIKSDLTDLLNQYGGFSDF